MLKECGKIREKLEAERNRLTEQLVLQDAEGVKDTLEYGPTSRRLDSLAVRTSDLATQFACRKLIREQLTDVERALKKMDDGTFGRCDRCGQAIPMARLEALPQTNLCIQCKTA